MGKALVLFAYCNLRHEGLALRPKTVSQPAPACRDVGKHCSEDKGSERSGLQVDEQLCEGWLL